MQDVELTDDAPDGVHESSPTPEATARVRRWRRRLIAGTAVLALALGVAQWVVTARENAALDRLAQIPGVLSPVDESFGILRRVASVDASELFGMAHGGLKTGADGSQSFTWDDPASGRPAWTTELLGPNDTPAPTGFVYGGTGCQTDGVLASDVGSAHRVVCLVTDGGTLAGSGGSLTEELPETTRQVVVLSIADGTVEARWPLGRGTSLAVLPDDVVVAGSSTSDAVQVTAYDLLTGAERWTHAETLPTQVGDAQGTPAISVFRAGDLVACSTPFGGLMLLSADGHVVRDDLSALAAGGGSWSTDPTTGRLIVQSIALSGESRSTFVARDGDPAGDLTFDGQLVSTSVDDGSLPGLILTYDTSLHGADARTGEARWSQTAYLTTGALILRGRIYMATTRGVVALDGTTGQRLWSSEGRDSVMPGSLATDGRHILLTPDTGGTDATPALVAYDPVTGEEAFRAPYPEGLSPAGEVGGRLLAHDAATDEFVLLG